MKVVFAGSPVSEHYRLLSKQMSGLDLSACPMSDSATLASADVVIALGGLWGAEQFSGSKMALLQRFGVGVDNVDLEAALKSGIWVANVPSMPSGNADAVADLALLLLLGVARHIRTSQASMSQGSWDHPYGTTLHGKTACLVGLGGLGLSTAIRLQACGMKLIGVRRNPEKPIPEELHFQRIYGSQDLHEALSMSFCSVLTATSDETTRHMMGTPEFQAMPRGSILVNVGRGSLVDEEALLGALDSGQLCGAGLDVFAREPLPLDDPLLLHPQVFATPHMGGATLETVAGIASYIGGNVRSFAAGKMFPSIVNHPPCPRRRLA